MKKPALLIIVIGALAVAVTFSGAGRLGAPRPDLIIERGVQNPFSHLRFDSDDGAFHFAIVSDRTGSHRAKVFSQAVVRLNLLQPAFVMSVGDLIEGAKKADALASQWKEFDGYIGKLTVPFFYVSGNHDVGNVDSDRFWREKLGRRHYSLVYNNVLLMVLNSDDPPGTASIIGKEQQAWIKKTLAENAAVRWTLVFVHRPLWTGDIGKNGWRDVEAALGDRPYTVFCGHVHRFKKFERHGRSYYQLATTGGGSKMRGVDFGEFDHITWVTMTRSGPVLAHVMLDAIAPDDMRPIESDEPGHPVKRKPVHRVSGKVLLDGVPIAGAMVGFEPRKTGEPRAEGKTLADGSFTLTTYASGDGAATGEYGVTVVWRRLAPDGTPGANELPARYAKAETSGILAVVQPGENRFTLELKK